MKLEERKCNLFNVGNEYALVHCISADYALGAGIAVDFQKKFHLKERLMQHESVYPNCIYIKGVYNLVTKNRYWQKPTYESLRVALEIMRDAEMPNADKSSKIAMPKIGCGLDRLQWPKVREIINDVFKNTDCEILVCSL
jgi:hypothetical protein